MTLCGIVFCCCIVCRVLRRVFLKFNKIYRMKGSKFMESVHKNFISSQFLLFTVTYIVLV